MSRLLFLRHGITGWNADRRLQGRRDTSLNDEGRAMVAAWRLPLEWRAAGLVASPLARCRETAEILRAAHPSLGGTVTDERLVEMSWGIWEGRSLDELEAALGAAAYDADHRPEGGESRRDMTGRVGAFLRDAAARDEDRVVVTHRGVIRVVYALATGWDLCGETPERLSRRRAHIFEVDAGGRPRVAALNLRLDGAPVTSERT